MTDSETLPLAAIQNWMQAMLVQSLLVSLTPVTTEEMVVATQRLTASQHLGIYRQSYIARLRACMQNQFKALAYALGEELFQAFADQYLDRNPSQSYTLNDLGEKFPAFLSQTRPDADSDQKESWPDFMIELATFEYALSLIFDILAAENADFTKAEIPDHLLTASPTLHLFEHQFPICRFYLDFNRSLSPELPFPQLSHCAVSRQNYKLGLFPTGADQYFFLTLLKNGASFTDAKAQLLEAFQVSPENFEKVWPIWRKNFMASGFLTRK